MFESKYSKVLTVVLVIVIIAIVVLVGFFAYDLISKYNSTKEASEFVEDYQSDITTGDKSGTDGNQVDGNVTVDQIEETPDTSSGTTSGKKKFKGFTVVGTMRIPTINLEYPIFEEVSTSALENGLIALYPNGDNINLAGNTVIIGHNYRNGMFFSNLKKLSNGDKVYVTDFRGKSVTYEVYNIFEASQTDTSFYARDTNGLPEITLSTCTDASNDQRTIIFARQV